MIIISLVSIALASAAPPSGDKVLNNAWYTMQAGSTPWGYFHELVEQRGDRYSYRSMMTKKEGEGVYQESVGALAEADLTPVAFNIVKSGSGASEIANATYKKRPSGGIFTIEIKGARSATFSRTMSKGAIVDVFFPLWLKQNWEKVKPRAKGWVYVIAEDPDQQDFNQKTVTWEAVEMDTARGCMKMKVHMAPLDSEWCINKDGQLVTLDVAGRHVERVKNEDEAKAFLAKAISPKSKSKK